jgi:NAD(P)-dependent dehydrogenase (short-subunit alcohol dehydrogenase family)
MGSPLQGQNALITGASRGLGLETACQFAMAGANLALLARDAVTLKIAGERVGARRRDPAQVVRTYPCDFTRESQVATTTAGCLADFGAFDVLVNNAAIQGPIGALESVDWDAWRAVFQVDLFAAAQLCRLLIPHMRKRGRGKIINLSGGGATGPRADLSAYAAAKTALVRLSETLAEELRGSGIDVNSVAPGAMNTRMLDELIAAGPAGAPREYTQALERAKAGGNPPARAAELVVWLASPESDGITGRIISAVWDDWRSLGERRAELANTDVFTLRRIAPRDRGLQW